MESRVLSRHKENEVHGKVVTPLQINGKFISHFHAQEFCAINAGLGACFAVSCHFDCSEF